MYLLPRWSIARFTDDITELMLLNSGTPKNKKSGEPKPAARILILLILSQVTAHLLKNKFCSGVLGKIYAWCSAYFSTSGNKPICGAI